MPEDEVATNNVEVTASGETTIAEVSTHKEEKPQTIDWKDTVPEEYREKPYVKELLKNKEPGKELFKQFDNLQTKLGQSFTLPDEKATDDDWDKFHEKVRPKGADEYDFEKVEIEDKALAEAFNEELSEDHTKAIKQIMHKHGLTKRQAKGVYKDVQEFRAKNFGDMHLEYATHQTKIDDEFRTLSKKAFGDKWEKTANELGPLVKESVPETVHPYLKDLPAPALMALALQAKHFRDKYEKEDSYGAGSSGSTGETADELRKEMRALMAEAAKPSAAMDPKYKEKAAYRKELAQRIDALERGGKK